MKKFMTGIVIFITIIVGVWGFFKVNIEATEAFNSSKYEKSDVDYEKIKSETGLDIKKLASDNSLIKTYDLEESFIVVFGKYKIDLTESILGRVFVNTMDTIDNVIKKTEDFFYDIIN